MSNLIKETLLRYYNAPPDKLIDELQVLMQDGEKNKFLKAYYGDLKGQWQEGALTEVNRCSYDTPFFNNLKEFHEYIQKLREVISYE